MIHLKDHAVFERDTSDLHYEMPISLRDRSARRRARDPGARRPAKIKVPAKTQAGKLFRLRGTGIEGVRKHASVDLPGHMLVETTMKLSGRQRELLAEFASLSPGRNNNPRLQSFMAKVKSFFRQ